MTPFSQSYHSSQEGQKDLCDDDLDVNDDLDIPLEADEANEESSGASPAVPESPMPQSATKVALPRELVQKRNSQQTFPLVLAEQPVFRKKSTMDIKKMSNLMMKVRAESSAAGGGTTPKASAL